MDAHAIRTAVVAELKRIAPEVEEGELAPALAFRAAVGDDPEGHEREQPEPRDAAQDDHDREDAHRAHVVHPGRDGVLGRDGLLEGRESPDEDEHHGQHRTDAVDALQRGIEKGKLKQPGLAALLMGMARFNQKKLPEARVWFQRAAAHREQKEHAQAWLNHTEKTLAAGTS